MRKIKFVDDGQLSLFDYNFGSASASVSGRRPAPTANKAAPCQFNKKMPPLPKNHHLMPYGVSDDDLKEVKNKSEIELFNEFYKFQNNVELNDEQKEYIEKIIKEVKEN